MAKRITVYKGESVMEVWEDKVASLVKKGWSTTKDKPKAEVKAKTPKPEATETNEA
tara:strand:- start:149 stop:316 length:168 start_codon:yes stop_codon:yes gene_type:complete